MQPTINERMFVFEGGATGAWRVVSMQAVRGEGLPPVAAMTVRPATVAGSGAAAAQRPSGFVLRGVTSNERYVVRGEKDALVARQQGLGRPEATRAALIPIRKSAAWWLLTQDERRRVLEDQSRHIAVGLEYLPAIARRLHHCRDLGEAQPFDFLTWFEYAPEHAAAFDELCARLRASAEWVFVEREIDIRLERLPA
jgi:hypothetical protein